MKYTNLKRFIFFVFALAIFTPAIVDGLHHQAWRQLDGAYNTPPPAVFSRESWLNGNFQSDYQKRSEFVFSLRPLFVRMRNQLNFKLWNEVNLDDQVAGKNNCLFSIVGMRSYLGKDTIPRNEINNRVLNIKLMRDKLAKRNIKLVIVMPPSHAYFFRNLFPEPYASMKKHVNDYDNYREILIKNKIEFLDLTPFFEKKRKTAKYPLYTLTGFHWSYYGAELATDTMMTYIEKTCNVTLPKREWLGIDITDIPQAPDNDIGLSMNLLWNIKDPILAYPRIKTIDSNVKKPNVMMMGDSYFNNMFDRGIFGNIFSDSSTFWYYNMTVRSKFHEDRKTQSYNLDTELKKRDIVILMINNTNFKGFPFDFDKRVLELP